MPEGGLDPLRHSGVLGKGPLHHVKGSPVIANLVFLPLRKLNDGEEIAGAIVENDFPVNDGFAPAITPFMDHRKLLTGLDGQISVPAGQDQPFEKTACSINVVPIRQKS